MKFHTVGQVLVLLPKVLVLNLRLVHFNKVDHDDCHGDDDDHDDRQTKTMITMMISMMMMKTKVMTCIAMRCKCILRHRRRLKINLKSPCSALKLIAQKYNAQKTVHRNTLHCTELHCIGFFIALNCSITSKRSIVKKCIALLHCNPCTVSIEFS